ncbi:MAG: efflux RND transporter permease subunit, partial [Saprospiraceae bacterium]|nr:efflux RND transporter permease subunit [Saprospiraceae bacterium]
EKLEVIIGAGFEFTQPIQLRFNELMTGAKTDIAVKIFGEDTELLKQYAEQAERIISEIPGAGDVKAEQTEGLPQLMIRFNRKKIAEYGLDISSINEIVRASFAGESAGVVFENERKFDLVVRLQEGSRQELALASLFIKTPGGQSIPLSELAFVEYTEGPMQISRENARRRINIGVNVRNRDIASLVADIQSQLESKIKLPPGYYFSYGGQFENLQKASRRLMIAVPVALLLIFALLYFTFEKIKYALLIFSAVPLSAIGGVFALWLRDMPFSISAGVGFIALFGVAVLNGIVLISHFNRMRYDDNISDMKKVVLEGSLVRLRPVIMTATVAALGFLPMALSTTNGAEVQRPLATVVIGGLVTATLLTLLVLPVMYYLVNRNIKREIPGAAVIALVLGLGFSTSGMQAQTPFTPEMAMEAAVNNNPLLQAADLQVQKGSLAQQKSTFIPATNFGLQGGQINTSAFDLNLSIEQSLGNFASNKARKNLAQQQVALSQAEKTRLEYHIKGKALKAYFNWYYAEKKVELLQGQLDSIARITNLAQVQFQNGEINKLDLTLLENEASRIQQDFTHLDQQRQMAYFNLQKQCLITDTLVMPAQVDFTYGTSVDVESTYLAPEMAQIEVKKKEAALVQSELKPSFSLGYFYQTI